MSKLWPDWITGWPKDMALERFSAQNHGDYTKWQTAIEAMPQVQTDAVTLNHSAITCELSGATQTDLAQMESCLRQLHPWRKGPFQLGPLYIATEWRSDWKWDRLAPAMGTLDGQRILDIGCGNGYFGWRMLGAGAASVVGVDPTLLFCMQHRAIQHFVQHPEHWVLPLGVEELTATHRFDWVLSMGVLYHRRDPLEHILQLHRLTEPGGGCVMETLIVEGDQVLYPEGRYARMRNIGAIPDIGSLERWMGESGFQNIQIVDVSTTGLDEQRSTSWMQFESLDKALDPSDLSKTVEGLPGPRRAMLIGERR